MARYDAGDGSSPARKAVRRVGVGFWRGSLTMPRRQSLSRSMNRIDGLIHSTPDFDEVMQRVISEAAQAVGSETAAISLRRGDYWVVRYVHGFREDVIGTRMNDRQEPHAVLAIETKKPVVIDDALTDKRVNRAHMKKWGVRSVLVVPLVTEEEAVGVLFLNRHKAATPFTASHIEFANQLASSLSLAIRNARLFESLQAELAERKRAEQALQEANERLQAQNEELQAQGRELQAQAEELRTQTEEVTAANEELREDEQALRRTEEALRRAHAELQAQSEKLTIANEELRSQSQELQESEQRLRMALEGGRMGRWEWDLVTDSMFWCARTYELLGLDTFRTARIETLLDCIHPDDRPAAKELLARVLNEAKDFQAEFRILTHRQEPRGEVRWLALHAKVIRDEQERAVRTIGVLYDATPRKQMEAELRRLNQKLEEEVQAQTDDLRNTIDRLQDEVVRRVLAEGKLRKSSRLLEAFFQHTIAPLAFLDRQFNFVQVNEAYARADGRPPDFFVHQNYFSLYPSEEDRNIFEQVVRTKKPYQAYAKLFPFSRGSQPALTYWNWYLVPLLNDVGEVHFVVFSLEDVTDRQRAFGELERRAHQLQKLTLELAQAEDRERRRLAEILHDDLQQVLAAAKFHLGLLHHRVQGDAEAKELADDLGRMLREAIEKSRSLSHELSPAVLYQGDLGETFEWLARQVQAKHGLSVHTEVHDRIDSPSEPIKAFLFRAAQEILFNAAKHAQVKEARLRLQRRRGQLWLTVADRGRGFDPQTLGQTSGFGLFSIRERAELLGGRMKIRSAKGRGAVFVIAINDGREQETTGRAEGKKGPGPVASSDVPALSTSDLPRVPRLRILLVDDHEILRAGLAALIGEQADLEVIGQAGDGHRAIELARGLGPDVVVMDVAMPTMPGDEAARQIKAIRPQTRIVALSMFEEPGVAQRMRDAGAEIYLPKTGPSDDLLAAIRGKE
jgi:PAS domain S-box-containing protein